MDKLRVFNSSFSIQFLKYSGVQFFPNFVRYKGHSKWQNIRHTKAEKDSEKGRFIQKHCNYIRLAISEGNSKDPNQNSKLAKAIKSALLDNVPKGTVNNVIKGFAKSEKIEVENSYLIRGPGKSKVIVSGFFTNKLHFQSVTIPILRKYGYSVEAGSPSALFDKKGYFVIQNLSSLEEAENIAVEVEAEDVFQIDSQVFEFICDPFQYSTVKENLLKSVQPDDIFFSDVTYIPKVVMECESELEKLALVKLVEALKSDHKIISVVHNIEM